MNIYLKKLELEESFEIFNLLQEAANGDWESLDSMTPEEFPKYIEDRYNEDLGTNLKEGRVPQTTYWFYVDGVPCGIIRVRRGINEFLLKRGGHIGYYIKKDYRRKGYGGKILSLCLNLLRREGLNKVLITCDDDNIGSQKIIEKNMGILENKVDEIRRYWINL